MKVRLYLRMVCGAARDPESDSLNSAKEYAAPDAESSVVKPTRS